MQHLLSIQALRALAAVMVVFHHAQNDAGRTAAEIGAPFARLFALPWAAGVDLFFVVSGFVMVFSSEKMFATPGGAGQFMSRRIARIVPLYWLATAIFVVAALRGAAAGKQLAPSLGEILSSFAFLPFPRGIDGAPRPVHSLGWTLEYEMFFYLVFACFLWLPRTRAVAGVAAFLGALVVANVAFQPQNVALAYWSDPIVLEFALGMGVALAHRSGLRLSNIFTVDDYAAQPGFAKNPEARRWNLFGYIDARDVAQACEDALEAHLTGAHAFIIAADDIILDLPSREALAAIHPDLTVPDDVAEFGTLLSNAAAKRALGFAPKHSWRDEVTGA